MYKVIVFDVDGTLIDTEKTTLVALQQVLKEDMNQDVPLEELMDVLGIPGERSIKNFELSDYESSLEKWMCKMDELRGYNELFSGISPLLMGIEARGLQLGIVTSRTKAECESDPLLESLIGYFDCIITADDTEKHKPNGAPLIKLLEKMDIDASEALYVGDTIYDSMCAKEARVDFIWAGWGTKEDIKNLAQPVAVQPMNLSNFIGHKFNFDE
jgi:HAD superfamily hydrolase (TIGR01549 family)